MQSEINSQYQEQLDDLVASLVKITQLVNKVPTKTSQEMLLKVESEEDEERARQVRKRAVKVLKQLLALLQYVQPENRQTIANLKNLGISSLLKEITNLPGGSSRYEELVERVSDDLLESVNNQLDLFKKQRDNPESLTMNKAIPLSKEYFNQDKGSQQMRSDNTMMKPQLAWWTHIDNSFYKFVPLIDLTVEKPFGKYPYPQEVIEAIKDKLANPMKFKSYQFGDHKIQEGSNSLPHPYFQELEEFDNQVSLANYSNKAVIPQKYAGLDNTPFLYVENEEQLGELRDHLSDESVREIAVDLEHHNFRSYQGFTCLMQVSTRFRDFIVDTLKLRQLVGPYLRPIFADPAKIKVLHGSDYDIEWLQKDFGLYIVNLFDTGQASRVLQHKSFSLAFLLQNYCSVLADKKYQLADWRQRPIPSEMLRYAREDTHYLLYIYDMMKNELLAQGFKYNTMNPHQFIKQTLHKSNALCLKTYDKPKTKDFNYSMIIGRNKTLQSLAEIQTLKAVLKWRDFIARIEDESVAYVMPNHVMFQICKDLPLTLNELRDSCRTTMTPIITKYADELIKLIAEKVNKAKNFSSKSHIKFEEGQKLTVKKDMKSDASSSSSESDSDEEMKQETPIGMTQLKFIEPNFPVYQIKLNQSSAKSVIFKSTSSSETKTSIKAAKLSAKKSASMEQQHKAADDQLSKLTFYDLLKTVTHCESLKIVDQNDSNNKKNNTILTAEEEEHLAQMLGKRSKVDQNKVDQEDNPVSQVDFIEIDKIKTTTGISKPQRQNDHQVFGDRDSLPQSVRERYQTHKKREDKQNFKKDEERKRDSTTSVLSVDIPDKQPPSKWSNLYGEASKAIGKLIDKQSERLQAKEDAAAVNSKQDKKGAKQQQQKKKNDAPQKSEGSQPQESFKKEKKPKYYLGSSIGGDKKFNAF